jgi:GrpB-like predicted nucleotidyltransferase (UPF0157 family)
MLVRVQAGEFVAAVGALRQLYAIHQPENWTPTYASFVDSAATDPPIGVQLVVTGSADDALFGPFRDALIRDPRLLSDYNALKRRLDGEDTSTTPTSRASSCAMCWRRSRLPADESGQAGGAPTARSSCGPRTR